MSAWSLPWLARSPFFISTLSVMSPVRTDALPFTSMAVMVGRSFTMNWMIIVVCASSPGSALGSIDSK
jgi:hypothetical protein